MIKAYFKACLSGALAAGVFLALILLVGAAGLCEWVAVKLFGKRNEWEEYRC